VIVPGSSIEQVTFGEPVGLAASACPTDSDKAARPIRAVPQSAGAREIGARGLVPLDLICNLLHKHEQCVGRAALSAV
jgi:hypothetical protein